MASASPRRLLSCLDSNSQTRDTSQPQLVQDIDHCTVQYLPVGIETFFIGMMKGIVRTVVRSGVGIYEMITFRYPQGPILEEMDEWVY